MKYDKSKESLELLYKMKDHYEHYSNICNGCIDCPACPFFDESILNCMSRQSDLYKKVLNRIAKLEYKQEDVVQGYKLYVMNEEQSREAQEKAFGLGYDWLDSGFKVIKASNFIYLKNKSMEITYSCAYGNFKDSSLKEITFEQWMAMEVPRKPFEAEGKIDGCGIESVLIRLSEDINRDWPTNGTKVKITEI
jgi:hypothetical protein